MTRAAPRYPIYIPSKGRPNIRGTAKLLTQDGVPFMLVVEPSQVEAYVKRWGAERVFVLPEDDKGLVYSRNWITDHARASGAVRHWQFDDDVYGMMRLHKGFRIACDANVAITMAESFVDRYENVALASFNSEFFLRMSRDGKQLQADWPPFYRNSRCYTNILFLNALPNRWRPPNNEDTDMSLQVLADGWCTILFNLFLMRTAATMTMKGGQTDATYAGDGRLRMSRNLERVWPGVVETRRRFGRGQHYIKHWWKMFDTPLKLRADALPMPVHDLELAEVGDVRSEVLRRLLEEERRQAP